MEYKIKSRIWIEVDGEILLGEGRVSLLKAIEKTGSLSKASKSLGMSYKKACITPSGFIGILARNVICWGLLA